LKAISEVLYQIVPGKLMAHPFAQVLIKSNTHDRHSLICGVLSLPGWETPQLPSLASKHPHV